MTSFPKPREQGTKASIEDILDVQHCSAAVLAVTNLISTSRAEITMAQLIDGLPLCDIAVEGRAPPIHKDHPLGEHLELCEGVLDKTRAKLGVLEVSKLRIEQSVCQTCHHRRERHPLPWMLLCQSPFSLVALSAVGSRRANHDQVLEHFQATDPRSHHFNLRLVETAAVAIHEIAISLFEDKPKSHDEDEIRRVTLWQKAPIIVNRHDVPAGEPLPPPSPEPTLFYHYRYLDHESYPAGLGDMAAYWAEVCIHIWLPFLSIALSERLFFQYHRSKTLPTQPKSLTSDLSG